MGVKANTFGNIVYVYVIGWIRLVGCILRAQNKSDGAIQVPVLRYQSDNSMNIKACIK